MRDLLGSLLGVPAAIAIAGGLGLMGVTVASRISRRFQNPIRWAHLALGLGMLGVGVALLGIDMSLLG